MLRLPQAITSVMLATLAGGAAGGITGFAIGRLAPTFIRWLCGPGPNADPADLAFGLGIVSGLVLGAGVSMFLAMAVIIRDGILANRKDLRDSSLEETSLAESDD